ncbi:MAG TPA: LysR family transcriptional regulator [Steroidobacteraceae bacterium]|nr:LysR family transcriptional regulator [Steroidobacteraceae bacterium]
MSMQHTTLRQLRVFEAAATLKSFSRAAETLHLTQPGVSMHIKELEGHAGLPLFERVGKKLFVTEAGRELLLRAREIGRALKDAEEALDALNGLRRGRVNLAVVSTAKYFAPRLLARFRKKFPHAEIRLAVNNRTSVIEQLIANEVDLAIMGRSPETLDTIAEPFAENPHVIIAAPDHPLARRRRIAESRVATETFVVREPGSGTRLAMQGFFRDRGLSFHVGMEMASNETIKQAVMAGMGISFISRHTIDLELHTGRLVALDVRGLPVVRHWHVAHLAKKRLPPMAAAFKEFVLGEGRALLRAEHPDRGRPQAHGDKVTFL